MSNCSWKLIDSRDGKFRYQCVRCRIKTGYTVNAAESVYARCVAATAKESEHYKAVSLLPADDRSLLGNRTAEMLAAIGIPPCGSCESRKEWLNRAHLWVRGLWQG